MAEKNVPATTAARRSTNNVISPNGKRASNGILPGAAGSGKLTWHVFWSHYQYNGGDTAQALHGSAVKYGLKSWYDNNAAEDLTPEAMQNGVRGTALFVIIMTSMILTRPFCQLEINEGIKEKKKIVLLFETDKDPRRGGVSIEEHKKQLLDCKGNPRYDPARVDTIYNALFNGGMKVEIMNLERWGQKREDMFAAFTKMALSVSGAPPRLPPIVSKPSATVKIAVMFAQNHSDDDSSRALYLDLFLKSDADVVFQEEDYSQEQLSSCSALVLYVTKYACRSDYIRKSVEFSRKKKIPVIFVLEENPAKNGPIETPEDGTSISDLDLFRKMTNEKTRPIPYVRREPFRAAMIRSILLECGVAQPILELPKEFDFEATAKFKLSLFKPSSRMDSLNALKDFVPSHPKIKAMVIKGEAGVGKSVLMAKFCADSPAMIGAKHFFSMDDALSLDPFICLFSLAQQLSNHLPKFRFALKEFVGGDPAEEDVIKTWAYNTGTLKDLKTAFSSLIMNPLARLSAETDPFYIVLDGLDYGLKLKKGSEDLNWLIQRSWKEAPAFVCLLISVREFDPVQEFPHTTLILKDNNEGLAINTSVLAEAVKTMDPKNAAACACAAMSSPIWLSAENSLLSSLTEKQLGPWFNIKSKYAGKQVLRPLHAGTMIPLLSQNKLLVETGHDLLSDFASKDSEFAEGFGVYHWVNSDRKQEALSFLFNHITSKSKKDQVDRAIYLSKFPEDTGLFVSERKMEDIEINNDASSIQNGSGAGTSKTPLIITESKYDVAIVSLPKPRLGYEQAVELSSLLEGLGVAATHITSSSPAEVASVKTKAWLVMLTDETLKDPTVQAVIRLKPDALMIMFEPKSERGGKLNAERKVDVSGHSSQAPEDCRYIFMKCELVPYFNDPHMIDAMLIRIYQQCKMEKPVLPLVPFDRYETPMVKAKDYVQGTRSWIFDSVNKWYNNQRKHTFILKAGAGVGKSVVTGIICARGSQSISRRLGWKFDPTAIRVGAFHFFKHDDKNAASVRMMLSSVASQLCSSVPGFRDAFLQTVKGFGKAVMNLPVKDLYSKLIIEPAQALSQVPEKRLLIILDALDECESSERGVFLDSIRSLERPSWLLVLISTRPDPFVDMLIESSDAVDFDELSAKDPRNRKDVTAYLSTILKDKVSDPKQLQPILDILEESADGLFLYVRFMEKRLDELYAEKRLNLESIKKFPVGISGVYEELFSRILNDGLGGDLDLYRSLLSPVLVARKPLPISVWETLLLQGSKPMQKKELDTVKLLISQLFYFTNNVVRVVHKSMSDWLLEDSMISLEERKKDTRDRAWNRAKDLAIESDSGHSVLGQFCDQRVTNILASHSKTMFGPNPSLPDREIDSFVIIHGFFHLLLSQNKSQHELARKQILDYPRLFARVFYSGETEIVELIDDGYLYKANNISRGNQNDDVLDLVFSAIRLSRNVIIHRPRELTPQILGRIDPEALDSSPNSSGSELKQFLMMVENFGCGPSFPWLVPIKSGLRRAGGFLLNTLVGHKEPVLGACFSNDGRLIATCSVDKTAKVWNAVNGGLIQTLTGDAKSKMSASKLMALCFTPNNKILLTAGGNGSVRFWDISNGRLLMTKMCHSTSILSICFCPDSSYFITGSVDTTAKVWKLNDDDVNLFKTFEDHQSDVTSVTTTKDSKLCLTTSRDGRARLWNLEGEEKTSPIVIFKLKSSSPMTCGCFSPDGKIVITGSTDTTVRIWNAKDGKLIQTLEKHVAAITSVSFSPKGIYFMTSSSDRTAKIWSISGRVMRTLEGHLGPLTSAQFSTDGELVVTASIDETARVWNAVNGNVLKAHDDHAQMVTSTALSPNGKVLVTTSEDKTAKAWRTLTGELIQTLSDHTSVVNSASFTPDGRVVVTAGKDETAKIWDLSKREPLLKTLKFHRDEVNYACFSPIAPRVVTACSDGKIRVFDAFSGRLQKTVDSGAGEVWDARFSDGGDMIIARVGEKRDRKVFDENYNVITEDSEPTSLTEPLHTDPVLGVVYTAKYVDGKGQETVGFTCEENCRGAYKHKSNGIHVIQDGATGIHILKLKSST